MLHIASRYASADIVEALLEHGALESVNATNNEGKTIIYILYVIHHSQIGVAPIFEAYANGNFEVCEVLTRAGATGDINTPNTAGMPLSTFNLLF